MSQRRPARARLAIAVAVSVLLGVAAGMGAHFVFHQSARATGIPLPDLHGQATWPAGERPAPTFTLRNVLGGHVALASTRGRPTLVTFLDSKCRSLCPIVGRDVGDVQRSLPVASRPAVLVVSVDPAGDTPASVRSAVRRWHLEPGWRWVTGSRRQLAAVWKSYGIEVEQTTNDILHGAAVYLLDSRGDERAGYLAPLLPNFISLDVRRVERESTS
jgi:cytochrome oxidase Cu insertion factor (SCO1/SenC/PrrC family)